MRQAEIEMAGPATVIHQHHQQAITAADETDRFKGGARLGRSCDQTHQPGEVAQTSGQLDQQVIECRPAQT